MNKKDKTTSADITIHQFVFAIGSANNCTLSLLTRKNSFRTSSMYNALTHYKRIVKEDKLIIPIVVLDKKRNISFIINISNISDYSIFKQCIVGTSGKIKEDSKKNLLTIKY